MSNPTDNPDRIEPVPLPPGVTAGPPTQMIIGGITSPQRVKIGSSLSMSVASMLLDKDGYTVTGDAANWSVTANPQPSDGISVVREQQMNGRVTAANIQRSHNVTLTVRSNGYPQLSSSRSFTISAY